MTQLSVVIPALNEAARLPETLAQVQAASATVALEIILADGGSTDATVAIAAAHGVTVVTAPRGRAQQMNAGAAAATGKILLFLHADARLPEDYADWVVKILAQPGVIAGAFELAIAAHDWRFRWLETTVRWRSRYLQKPYGDQALFLRAATFRDLGGFLPLPIMEDYELVQRLRRRGRVAIAPRAVQVSSRRWQKLGLIRTTVINQLMVLGYHLGIPPARLARLYYGRPPQRQRK
ncbi:MAG: glycosyltransferase family 2 protein [Spirulinaceae cyanobacterium SM2_1_0]|nr:glycosyltransferase family 2 protein [Spirulinaceae cyanobacterium SM2_1_0]